MRTAHATHTSTDINPPTRDPGGQVPGAEAAAIVAMLQRHGHITDATDLLKSTVEEPVFVAA